MPIGKNSLKRVANNGYSNVKTSAPDMENSVELKESEVNTEAKIKKTASAKSTAQKQLGKENLKTAPKSASKANGMSGATQKSQAKAPAKKAASMPAVKTAAKAEVKSEPEKKALATAKESEKSYINVGGEMPVYLL